MVFGFEVEFRIFSQKILTKNRKFVKKRIVRDNLGHFVRAYIFRNISKFKKYKLGQNCTRTLRTR